MVELAVVAALTAAAAALFERGLHSSFTYDEGVYLSSLDDLRDGAHLGQQIFASQPPGYYLFLEGSARIFGDSVSGLRVASIILALVGCLSAYLLGRRLAGRAAGVLTCACVATAPRFADEAARVRADMPAIALSLASLAAASYIGRGGWRGRAVPCGAGVLLALAVSMKFTAATVIVPVLLMALLRGGRRAVGWLVLGSLLLTGVLLAVFAGSISALWRDAVSFHLTLHHPVPGAPTSWRGNVGLIYDGVTGWRGPTGSAFIWLVPVAALALLLGMRRRLNPETWVPWSWAVLSLAFLVWHKPLWGHHVILLEAAFGIAASIAIVRAATESRSLGLAICAVAAGLIGVSAVQAATDPVQRVAPTVDWAVSVLEQRTPPGATVVTDEQIIPYLARRHVPPTLVDTSRVTVAGGGVTMEMFERAATLPSTSAVVLAENFGHSAALRRRLRSTFPVVESRPGITVYLR